MKNLSKPHPNATQCRDFRRFGHADYNHANTPTGMRERKKDAISALEKMDGLGYNGLFVGKQDSRKIIAAIYRKRTTDRAQNFPAKNQKNGTT